MDRQLIDYLPGIIREIREYKAIMDAEQPEMVNTWTAIEDTLDNLFVMHTNEMGIERWEKLLEIIPQATRTLADRQFLVLARIGVQLPYTLKRLHEQLTALCGQEGYSVTLQNTVYTIEVKVNLIAKNSFNDVDALLQRVIPANLVIDLKLIYNQHMTLAGFTHAQLGAHTHHHIRNEVLT